MNQNHRDEVEAAEAYDVLVGVVRGAHGLRGLVRVWPETDLPDRHRTLKYVMARWEQAGSEKKQEARLLTIEYATPVKRGLWLVKFAEITDRTQAEQLRGAGLYIREAELPPLPPGEYYVHQIIGLQVRTTTGRELGPVTDVLFTGANDVYVTAAGLLPATQEVVKEIDLEAGVMIVEPLPGMLDEPEDAD